MNIEKYIESGILDAYVLGALNEEECAEVQANMAEYPEVAAEVAAIETSMQAAAEENAVSPAAFMKEKIWTTLQEQHSDGVREAKSIPFPVEEKQRQKNWARAAVWLALLGSLLTNIILWSQSNTNEQKVVAYNAIVDSMQANQEKLATIVESYKKEKDMVIDPSMETVMMKSMKEDKSMAGTIYWSKEKGGDTYLALHNMPMPKEGMQYQLWVIEDGKPKDMGVISNDMVEEGMMQKIPMSVTEGQAFAISMEKMGGSAIPTMEEVYIMGSATS